MLLDLLGSNDPPPRIHNSYLSGDKAFERLISIGTFITYCYEGLHVHVKNNNYNVCTCITN